MECGSVSLKWEKPPPIPLPALAIVKLGPIALVAAQVDLVHAPEVTLPATVEVAQRNAILNRVHPRSDHSVHSSCEPSRFKREGKGVRRCWWSSCAQIGAKERVTAVPEVSDGPSSVSALPTIPAGPIDKSSGAGDTLFERAHLSIACEFRKLPTNIAFRALSSSADPFPTSPGCCVIMAGSQDFHQIMQLQLLFTRQAHVLQLIRLLIAGQLRTGPLQRSRPSQYQICEMKPIGEPLQASWWARNFLRASDAY